MHLKKKSETIDFSIGTSTTREGVGAATGAVATGATASGSGAVSKAAVVLIFFGRAPEGDQLRRRRCL